MKLHHLPEDKKPAHGGDKTGQPCLNALHSAPFPQVRQWPLGFYSGWVGSTPDHSMGSSPISILRKFFTMLSALTCKQQQQQQKGKQWHPLTELWQKLKELIQIQAQHVEALVAEWKLYTPQVTPAFPPRCSGFQGLSVWAHLHLPATAVAPQVRSHTENSGTVHYT